MKYTLGDDNNTYIPTFVKLQKYQQRVHNTRTLFVSFVLERCKEKHILAHKKGKATETKLFSLAVIQLII